MTAHRTRLVGHVQIELRLDARMNDTMAVSMLALKMDNVGCFGGLGTLRPYQL